MKLFLIYATILFLILPLKVLNAQDSLEISEAAFRNPPLAARPRALWPWVNGNFSLSRITAELEEAKAKGMGGFDIWDVGTNMNPDGIVPDAPAFLSDESLDGIAHAIREAGRVGLELGLITSSSWNAGGQWVKPEHGAMGLFRSDTVILGPTIFKEKLPFPHIPPEYGNRKNLIKRDASGLPVVYREVALLMHQLSDDSVVRGQDIVPLDPSQNAISVPKGKWRIVRYVTAPTGQPLMVPSPNSDGLMLDHFSAEAQEANFNYIFSRLKTKFKSLDNLALKYLYEDSYEVNTAVWTFSLPEYFKKTHGYDVVNFLPALDGFIVDNADKTQRFTFDFNKVLSEMIIENHYKKGRELAAKEGLGFYAEAGGPGKPIHNVPFEDLKALGSLTVPRGEFWNAHSLLNSLQIVKGISSAAHIYNQRFVEAESFTSVWLWQEGPNELKPLADRAMCEGLNRFIYHTFPHTTAEAGTPGWIYNFGTLINTTNGWWDKSSAFHLYLARCSYLLQQGNFRGDVAFYYGDEAPNFVPPKHVPPSLGKGYDYDVINTEVLLDRVKVSNGKLVLPHGQTYEVLVLPEDVRINPAVLKKIEQLIRDGATVIGRKPLRSYSLTDAGQNDQEVKNISKRIWGDMRGAEKNYGKGKIVWRKSIRQVLMEKHITPDVQFIGENDSCDFIHRSTKDAEIYFIRNSSKKRFEGSVVLRVTSGSPEFWNPVDATIVAIEKFQRVDHGTQIELELQGEESVFIIFREGGTTGLPDVNRSSDLKKDAGIVNRSIELKSPWELRFGHEGNSPISLKMPKLASWHTSELETVRYFSGTATYTNHFIVSPADLGNSKAILALNKVEEVADVYINGYHIGTHWFDHQTFNIGDYLKEGDNTILIEVANTINNGLVGDARKPKEYRKYRSNITRLPNAWMKPFAEASLLPAGLLGPVEIRLVNTK
jgi:hypothetical protein